MPPQVIDIPGMGQVEFPEGMSDDQIVAAIKANQKQPARSMPPAKSDPMLAGYSPLLETVKDLPKHYWNALSSVGSGLMDLPVGAGQLVANAVDLVTPKTQTLSGLVTGEQPETFLGRYNNFMKQREQEIAARRAGYENLPDVGRMAGQFIASAPAGAGAGALPTLGARMVQGAKTAGGVATAMPVGGNPDDFWLGKGVQTGGSALLGAAAPPVIEGVLKGAGAAVNSVVNAFRGAASHMGGATPQAIETTLRIELQNAGVDWNALNAGYRQQLMAEVQRAVNSGGSLDPAAIRRLADFQRVGTQPLAGQLSRDPLDFAREQNLAGTESGRPIANRIVEQNQAFVNAVPVGDRYASGQAAISSLTGRDAPRRAAVTGAYDAARAEAGLEADVPLQPVAQRIGQLVEDFGTENIPAAVMKRLNEFGLSGGTQTRVFNIREAEKLKTLISNNIENPRSPTGVALMRLRASVDDAVNSLADVEGAQAAQAFQTARGLHSARMGNIERTPALGAALEGAAPDRFIEQYAIRGNVGEVANFMRNMTTEGRQATREGVMDWLRQQAVSGAGDAAKFSQAGFNRAMQTIGDRKLELIFAGDLETLGRLRALGRASAAAMVPPPASRPNYSGSGTAILDAIDRMSAYPFPFNQLGRPGDIIRAHQATSALTGAPVQPAAPLLGPALLDELGQSGGILSRLAAPQVATGILGGR